MTPSDRFWAKVSKTEGCWEWTASKSEGYGRFSFNGKLVPAHRWAWEEANGPVPLGMVMDHLCRNRGCVRPDHLEPVTNQENTRRGIAAEVIYQRQAEQTHCANGHEFTPENTRPRSKGKGRVCRACARDLASKAAKSRATCDRCGSEVAATKMLRHQSSVRCSSTLLTEDGPE